MLIKHYMSKLSGHINNLLNVFDKVSLDIRSKLSHFDAMIASILTYGCEVWGFSNYKIKQINLL
jgi:hypothetical protein